MISTIKSLRGRVTLMSTAVLLIVLAVASIVIVSLVDRQLRNELSAQNEATLTDTATRIEAGEDPTRIVLPLATDGTEFIVLDPNGESVNATVVVTFDEAPLDASAGESIDETPFQGFTDFDPDDFTTESREAVAPDGSVYTVLALNPTAVVERNVAQVRSVLWIVIPTLAAVFALLVWFLTGRVLRPVDAISAKAQRIRTETLHERIDEPGTADEIDRLAKTLNSMLDRLDRGARAQQQFVSDASHELQSPLTVLLGEAQLAAGNPTAERLAAANALVIEHGERMALLIRDLLDLARADESDLHRSEIDLDDLIHKETALHPASIDASRVQPVRMVGHASSISRVVRNLIDNAHRHGGARIEVSCTLDPSTHQIQMVVDDDGPGIPADQREAVFERFGRLDESRDRSTGGTGLGLAIVQAIVDAHDGTITVSDAEIGGARVAVHFPHGR